MQSCLVKFLPCRSFWLLFDRPKIRYAELKLSWPVILTGDPLAIISHLAQPWGITLSKDFCVSLLHRPFLYWLTFLHPVNAVQVPNNGGHIYIVLKITIAFQLLTNCIIAHKDELYICNLKSCPALMTTLDRSNCRQWVLFVIQLGGTFINYKPNKQTSINLKCKFRVHNKLRKPGLTKENILT